MNDAKWINKIKFSNNQPMPKSGEKAMATPAIKQIDAVLRRDKFSTLRFLGIKVKSDGKIKAITIVPNLPWLIAVKITGEKAYNNEAVNAEYFPKENLIEER